MKRTAGGFLFLRFPTRGATVTGHWLRPPALVLATHGYVLPDQELKRDDSASLAGGGSNRSTRAVTTTGEPIEDPLLRCGLLPAGANLTSAGKTLPGDDGILTGAEIVGLDILGPPYHWAAYDVRGR
jgi:hypothetical protein